MSHWIVLGFTMIGIGFARADVEVVLPNGELFANNAKEFMVKTTIPGDFESLEGILWGLLVLSAEVENEALLKPFVPAAIQSSPLAKDAKPLAAYFRGVKCQEKKVILCFSKDGLRYLNASAAIQQVVKGALQETVKLHCADVEEIVYEIDGAIFNEWDA